MDTVTLLGLDDPDVIEADHKAVREFVNHKTPIEPEALARIRARAERVREKTRLKFGFVDIEALLPSVTDE